MTHRARLFRWKMNQWKMNQWTLCLGVWLTVATQAIAQPAWTVPKAENSLRIATFNVSLNRPQAGQLAADLKAGDPQARAIASVIRGVRPDIILLNEVDFVQAAGDEPKSNNGTADTTQADTTQADTTQADTTRADATQARELLNNAARFAQDYLADPALDGLGGQAWPMEFVFAAPVNTGVLSEVDVNQDGKIALPDDAWGYGRFPGQYGMALLSRFPIATEDCVSLQHLGWAELPEPLRPTLESGESYYDDVSWSKLRIASKSFWDVPIATPLGTLHALASHPTPPAFDGPEDRNGCRNHDEIRLIELYIERNLPENIGLDDRAAFVVLGDLNSDPVDGDSRQAAIAALIEHPRMAPHAAPASEGGKQAAQVQGGVNRKHRGDPAQDTADFNDRGAGNLRVDYALPSRQFQIIASGVFWPRMDGPPTEVQPALQKALNASDHHLVWVDIKITTAESDEQLPPTESQSK